MKVPYMEGVYLDFGWMNIPVLFFIVIGTVNGTNFTDGVDGLAKPAQKRDHHRPRRHTDRK